MREIKFRVWEPLNKKMECFDFTLYKFSRGRNSHKFVLPPNRQSMQNPYTIMNMDAVDIMQYTGLKDKNGVDIYENDILLCVDELDGRTIRKGYVIFERASYWVDYEPCYLESNDVLDEDIEYEVIGNIYENKDLINHPYVK